MDSGSRARSVHHMIEFIEPVVLLVVALVARSVSAEAPGNERSHSDANNARWRVVLQAKQDKSVQAKQDKSVRAKQDTQREQGNGGEGRGVCPWKEG